MRLIAVAFDRAVRWCKTHQFVETRRDVHLVLESKLQRNSIRV